MATLIDLLRVLRRRIPSKHLPIFGLQLLSVAVLRRLQVTTGMQSYFCSCLVFIDTEEKLEKSYCDR